MDSFGTKIRVVRRHCLSILALMGLTGAVSGCAADPGPQTVAATVAAPAPPPKPAPAPEPKASGPEVVGLASWYRPGPGLHRTCTGETFTRDMLSAASPTLPMGTMVRVSCPLEHRSVVVRVNDRMPRGHRVIDLSEKAARLLGLTEKGIETVSVTPVEVAENP
ncbi:MAG: septal ring lytic transglycosylase RlpA family protein [Acidocella sp.]|nr:septal ring lytic transglycosylase RlpA family protein [Acidocella sp.]